MLMQSGFSIVEGELTFCFGEDRRLHAEVFDEIVARNNKNTLALKINMQECNKKTMNETHLLKIVSI